MTSYPWRVHVAFVVTLAAVLGSMYALIVFGERELSGVLLVVAAGSAALLVRFMSRSQP